MQDVIQSIKKKNLEKKVTLFDGVNSKSFLSAHSMSSILFSISNNINVYSKKPTYFFLFFSACRESNCKYIYSLLNKKIVLKEESNTSL